MFALIPNRRFVLDTTAIHRLVLLLLPWIFLAVDPNWIYSAKGTVDPWLYHGYFHRFPEFVSALHPDRYYGTRLAWIVPGYVAYALLPPHAANLTLHLSFYYLTVGSIYRMVKVLADRQSALMTATVFGGSWPVLGALGWDYVDGPLIAYFSVALASALHAARGIRPRFNSSLAGVAGAAMVHCNLGAVLLAPAGLTSYFACRSTLPDRTDMVNLAAFTAGAVAVTAMLGAVDAWAGGPWLFFMPSLQWVRETIGVQKYAPMSLVAWPNDWHLVWPAIGAGTAILLLAKRRTGTTFCAALPIAVTLLVFILYDWAVHGAMLRTYYYVSWMLPLTFLAIGVLIHARDLGRSVLGSVVVLLVTAFTVLMHARGFTVVTSASGYAMMAATAGALLVAYYRRLVPAIVAVACLVNAMTPLDSRSHAESRDQFDVVQRALDFVSRRVPADRSPVFWIEQGPSNPYLASITATHLYLYSLLGANYPHLPDDATTRFRAGATLARDSTVIVLSYHPPDATMLQREFARFDLEPRIYAVEPVSQGSVEFVLTAVAVSKR